MASPHTYSLFNIALVSIATLASGSLGTWLPILQQCCHQSHSNYTCFLCLRLGSNWVVFRIVSSSAHDKMHPLYRYWPLMLAHMACGPYGSVKVRAFICWPGSSPQSARIGELYLSVPAVDSGPFQEELGVISRHLACPHKTRIEPRRGNMPSRFPPGQQIHLAGLGPSLEQRSRLAHF